jgi:hypothetical protein
MMLCETPGVQIGMTHRRTPNIDIPAVAIPQNQE